MFSELFLTVEQNKMLLTHFCFFCPSPRTIHFPILFYSSLRGQELHASSVCFIPANAVFILLRDFKKKIKSKLMFIYDKRADTKYIHTEANREKARSSFANSLLKACNNWSSARPKPGPWNSNQVSDISGRNLSVWTPFVLSSVCIGGKQES